MTADVVKFVPANPIYDDEDYVWQCICGCTEFFLVSDGSVQCCECEIYSSSIICVEVDALPTG